MIADGAAGASPENSPKTGPAGVSIPGESVRRIDESRNYDGGDEPMRVMVMVKATEDSEAGVLPSTELIEAMGKYNEELVNAGIMLAGDGLQPSKKGARVMFSGTKRSVVDGPFSETKELIAGYWIWEVKSMDEAIEWVKRCPNPMEGESIIEIRPFFSAEDFGEAYTPEQQARDEKLRQRVAAKQ
jgi:hypothetical protein